MFIMISDPPMVHAFPNQNIIKGRDLSVTCAATPGNPSSTTFYRTKIYNPGFRQNGATLQLPNIQRNRSGPYRCRAENNYINGEKGAHSQSMEVNVLCRCSIYYYMYTSYTFKLRCAVTFFDN